MALAPDEMYVKLNGAMAYLWRAIDREGEILESFMTRKRDIRSIGLKKALKRVLSDLCDMSVLHC